MKIKVISLISSIIVMIIAVTLAFVTSFTAHGVKNNSPITSAAASAGYYLKEYNGKIGVFNAGIQRPEQILDVYIASLPQKEQLRLRNGIHAQNKNELLQLIEDYTS